MAAVTLELLESFLNELGRDLLTLIPKIILAIIVVAVAYVILRFVGWAVRKVLALANVEDLVRRYLNVELPVSLTGLVLAIFYVAVGLSALYGVVNILLGEPYVELANSLLTYGARLLSVIALTLIFFAIFASFVERMKTESTYKTYMFFVVILLIVAMLIDVTPLSDPVKNALYSGLSIGVGVSLSVFAVWFFFHNYLEKYLEQRSKVERRKP